MYMFLPVLIPFPFWLSSIVRRSMKEEATQLNQDLKTIKESRDDLERVSLQQRERLKYLKSTIRDFIQQQRDLSAKEKVSTVFV